MKDSTPKYRVRLGLHIDTQNKDGYFRVTAYPVTIGKTIWEQRWTAEHPNETPASYARITDETIRNCGDELYNGLRLDCLRIDSLGTNDDDPRHLFGWETRYHDVYSIDQHRAEGMAKTLKTIYTRTEKLAEKYGRPATFGQYIARIAAAIGAEAIVFVDSKNPSGWHNRDSHRFYDIGTGITRIDGIVREWIDARMPKPAEHRAEVTS